MITIRNLHEYQRDRRQVVLNDGRVGRIVRVDTNHPGNRVVVSLYTTGDTLDAQPGITSVDLDRIVGLANAS